MRWAFSIAARVAVIGCHEGASVGAGEKDYHVLDGCDKPAPDLAAPGFSIIPATTR
jgi:hypothetical protein